MSITAPARVADKPASLLRPRKRAANLLGWPALFALVAGVTLFYNLDGCHTLGSHEAYAAVPAREMMETGDWTIPRFAGVPRLTKPPLVYWMLASLGTACGGLNEGLARAPQAVAALLLAVLIGLWARRWYGNASGWAAAFIHVTVLYVMTYGRKAEIDMTLWLFIAAALFLIAHQPADESRRRSFLRWGTIGGLIAVSWLAKFHYGAVMIVAPAAVFFLVQGRPRHLLRFLNPVGLAFIATAVVVWPWLVLQQHPDALAVWNSETIGRAIGEKGHKPVWYYIPVVLVSFLPWTPIVLAAVPRSWREAWKERNPNERFLWIWFLTHFLIVTAQANKHVHYINAALPALTLLAARHLPGLLRRLQEGSAWVGVRPAALTTLTVGPMMAAAAIALAREWPQTSSFVAGTGIVVGVGVPAGAWLAAFGRFRTAGLVAVGTFLGAFAFVHGGVIPRQDNRLVSARFARESREEAGPETPVATYRLGQHSSTYYLGRPARRIETLDELRAFVRKHGRVFVMAVEPFNDDLQAFPHQQRVRRMRSDPSLPPLGHPPFVLHEVRSDERRVARR